MTLSYFNAEVIRTVAALEVENERLRGELERVREQAARATQEAARFAKEAEQAKSDKELFAQRYQLLVQQLFGKKSERRVLDQSENQTLPLFPLGELPSPPPSSKKETITYTRTKPSAAPRDRQSKFPESLRRLAVDVPPEEACCTCCGKEMKHLLRTVVTEKLCCSRDPFFVKQYRRPVYACRECDTAASAPAVPEEVFERAAVEESVVAYLAVNKFRYSLPLYRQGIQLRDLGLSFSEDALVDWTLKGAALLMPVYDELSRSVEGSSYLLADDTPFKAGVRSPSGIQYQRGCLWSLLGDQRDERAHDVNYFDPRPLDLLSSLL
jgi:transposase